MSTRETQFNVGDIDALRDVIRRDCTYTREPETGRIYAVPNSPYYYGNCTGIDAPAEIDVEVDGCQWTLTRNLGLSDGQVVAYNVEDRRREVQL